MKNLLKNVLYLLIIPLSLAFMISCSEDDDDGGDIGSRSDLIGTWTVDGVTFEFTIDGVDIITWLVDNLGLSTEDADEFRGIFEAAFEEGFISGTITFDDDGTYQSTIGGEADSGDWELNGSTLTIQSSAPGDSPTNIEITTLTSSSAVLSFSETEEEDFDDDGTREELAITIEMTLSK